MKEVAVAVKEVGAITPAVCAREINKNNNNNNNNNNNKKKKTHTQKKLQKN